MIYVYRRRPSDSARDLAESMNVNCRRLNDLGRAHFGAGVRAGDTIICWGEQLAPIAGVRILNGTGITNKLDDANKLKVAGVATVEVSRTRPNPGQTADPLIETWQRLMREVAHPLTRPNIIQVEQTLRDAINLPIPRPATWLGRRFNHIGGADLLTPPPVADYWSKKESIVEEYRIHCFNGKSIRAGVKVPRDGAQPHEWVRSLEGGWRIKYDDFHSKSSMRDLAAKAVQTLGLDFGAVDLGRTADKKLIVLEVNRAPGLEGGTLEAYANAVESWIKGA